MDTLEIEVAPLDRDEDVKSIEYFNQKIRRGINLVLWVSEDVTATFEPDDILKQVNAIRMEQIRLTDILVYKGTDCNGLTCQDTFWGSFKIDSPFRLN